MVVLPTGLGKTVIAVLVAAKTLEISPPDSKIVVLAPTRPLIHQHYESFTSFLDFSKENFCTLTGKTPPERRAELFEKSKFLFFTPQTLRNDLTRKMYALENTCLLIIDEAHHSSGEYPYPLIADKYVEQNPDGTILALTASPGASRGKIKSLCESLHVPLENIHARTRKDEDVKSYLKPMELIKIGVDITDLMINARSTIVAMLEERLHYLFQFNFLEAKDGKLYEKVARKDLLRLNLDLINIINGSGDKTGAYAAISINAQALILYHAIDLIEQQGLDILLEYLDKLQNDARKKNSSKAIILLASDFRLQKLHREFLKIKELSPEQLIHPKYYLLERVVLEELAKNPESRTLIFVKLRNSVKNIVSKLKLKAHEGVRPAKFVGQATKSKDDKGLPQKDQLRVLALFKAGKYNVLVSTNVGEEGLDVAECDLVVFYDVVASETRFIQRKGRTARHREGKVIVLYCKNTHDEAYLDVRLS